MITRICISINNRCNLNCKYCHFHEKSAFIEPREMNIFAVLDNVKAHIKKHKIPLFKIGFVGNGEPLLDFESLRGYVEYIADYLKSGVISAYTITNGTLINEEMLGFFREHKINVGFSIDGVREIHNKLRCNSFDRTMNGIELFRKINGFYPSMNCTVGQDVLERADETIDFFAPFDSRITFSRMIGENGISLADFRAFLERASRKLSVRTGGFDCTMYGGKCGAGIDNPYFANGSVFICGNCVDLPTVISADTPLDEIDLGIKPFDRRFCYKEVMR